MPRLRSLIYTNQHIYHWLMRGLYGRHFAARYQDVAERIGAGASVVDLCAGDGYIYFHYLRQKNVAYTALDISPYMVRFLESRGVEARAFNLWEDGIPPADYVIMQGSLYQFIPKHCEVVARMLKAARREVIIAEPVHCLSASPMAPLARISRLLTTPLYDDGRYTGERLDEAALMACFQGFDEFCETFPIAGGQEIVGVFRGREASREDTEE